MRHVNTILAYFIGCSLTISLIGAVLAIIGLLNNNGRNDGNLSTMTRWLVVAVVLFLFKKGINYVAKRV